MGGHGLCQNEAVAQRCLSVSERPGTRLDVGLFEGFLTLVVRELQLPQVILQFAVFLAGKLLPLRARGERG
jgi:hypothetical protein